MPKVKPFKKRTIMKCEDFKKHIADLCDKSIDETIKADCMQHIEECASCRAYYKEFMHTVGLLTPRHAPQPHRNKRQTMQRRLLQVAAAILVFLAGVGVGLSNLFSTQAEASPSITEVFDQCIRHSREAKGFSMRAYVRTTPQENFAFIDPEAGLLQVRVSLLRQGGSTIWRIEKEGGRTIVSDGSRQYMWDNTGTGVCGSLQARFAEGFALFLQPEFILEKLNDAMLAKDMTTHMTVFQSDSIIIVEASTTAGHLAGFFSPASRDKDLPCTARCVFRQQDYRLKEMEIRCTHDGKETVVFQTSAIRYDAPLSVSAVTQRPGAGQIKWLRADGPRVADAERLGKLQKETATEAARRILEALIAGQPHEEALYYYAASLPSLTEEMKGCRVSGFSEAPADKEYAGTTVRYELRRPDGTTEQRRIALRRDNQQRIWIVDGGL